MKRALAAQFLLLLVGSCLLVSGCGDQEITFVHVNDLHGHYTPLPLLAEFFRPRFPYQYTSPFARVRGYFEQVKSENPYTLLTNGGDDHEKGSVAEALSRGWATLEAVFALGFDVRVLGNHDFAWGEEEFLAFSRDPQALVLASNTEYTGEGPERFGAVPYGERQLGQVRLGFFGMCPRPYDETNGHYTGPYLDHFETRYDFVGRAREIVEEHRGDVDLLVMVSHLGLGEDKEIAAEVDGIDIILGGHSHSTLWVPEVVNDTVIIQCGSSADYVGRLDVTYSPVQGTVQRHSYGLHPNLPGFMPVDPAVQLAVEGIMERYAPDALLPVGRLQWAQGKDGVSEIACRAVMAVEGVDAALLDEDTLWALDPLPTWRAGEIYQQRLLDTFKMEMQPAGTPAWTAFYRVDVSGADLVRIRDGMGDGWTLVAPQEPEPEEVFSLALNKRTAFHPEDYLPPAVTVGEPVFLNEVWEVLDSYARGRTRACLFLDREEPIPGCF